MCLACTHNSVVLVFSRVEATLRVKELYATYIHETYMPTDRHTYMHTWIKTYMHAYKHEAWSMTLSYFMHSSLHAYMHMFIIMSNIIVLDSWLDLFSPRSGVIQEGDRVLAIDGQSLRGWTTDDLQRMMLSSCSAGNRRLLIEFDVAGFYGLFLRAMHFRPLIGHRTDIGFKIDRLSDWV